MSGCPPHISFHAPTHRVDARFSFGYCNIFSSPSFANGLGCRERIPAKLKIIRTVPLCIHSTTFKGINYFNRRRLLDVMRVPGYTSMYNHPIIEFK